VIDEDHLTDVFDRGLRDGIDALAPSDQELFRIQDFIIEFEMNGLTGYFYNRLPDQAAIVATAAAMRRHGLLELGSLLEEAGGMFAGYADLSPETTWGDVCRNCDPA
jgi:hypothetical protein